MSDPSLYKVFEEELYDRRRVFLAQHQEDRGNLTVTIKSMHLYREYIRKEFKWAESTLQEQERGFLACCGPESDLQKYRSIIVQQYCRDELDSSPFMRRCPFEASHADRLNSQDFFEVVWGISITSLVVAMATATIYVLFNL